MKIEWESAKVEIKDVKLQEQIKSLLFQKRDSLSRQNKKWTDSEIAQATSMYREGKKPREISKELKRSNTGVSAMLNHLKEKGILQRSRKVETFSL